MNKTTRSAKTIRGSSFEIFCKNPSNIHAYKYISGILSEIQVTYSDIENEMKRGVADATEDGYYFVTSGRNVQILKRGDVENRIFLVDYLGRTDLDLNPESYNEDGEKIGDNQYEHIGHGIYKIIPISLEQTVVKVMGNLYSSYPLEDDTECEEKRVSSAITIGTKQKKTAITIGGSDIITEVQRKGVKLSAHQTVFRI